MNKPKQPTSREIVEAASSLPDVQAVRTFLASYPPQQVLSVCYGRAHAAARSGALLAFATEYPRSTALLEAVYGVGPLSSQLPYVRMPSRGKRQLTLVLAAETRRRWKWVSSRLLHVWAFRPQWFESRVWKDGQHTWQGLYREARIPMGSGRQRVLHVPSPPLATAQRILLAMIAPGVVQSLPPWVMGIGGSNRSIFDNARYHLGQRFAATFDIKNFFGSVRAGSVVEALLAQQLPISERFGINENWTRDAAAFVARFCSRRGRLPQGAATSPLLASLAFTSVDKDLIDQLGPVFRYSRYFDDVTISVDAGTASRLGITNPNEFLAKIKPIVIQVAHRHRYRLQTRKTAAADLRVGHEITGIRVHNLELVVSRETKRRMRALQNRLERLGFVQTARRLYPPPPAHQLLDEADPLGVRRVYRLSSRRLPYESLGAMMLEAVAPEVVVRSLTGQLPIDLGFLLGHIWRRLLRAERPERGRLVFSQGGQRVVEVQGPPGIDFLLLAFDDARPTIELWHHLRGMAAFFGSAGDRPDSQQWFAVGEELKRLTDNVTFEPVVTAPAEPPPHTAAALSSSQAVSAEASRVFALVRSEMQALAAQPRWTASDHKIFVNGPDDRADLPRWLDAAAAVCALPKIPPVTDDTAPSVFAVLPTWADLERGRRCGDYNIVERYFSVKKLHRSDPQYAPKAALTALRDVARQLARSETERSQSHQHWLEWLAVRKPLEVPAERLEREVDRLASLHSRLVEGRSAFFTLGAERLLKRNLGELKTAYEEAPSQVLADAVLLVGRLLHSVTIDATAVLGKGQAAAEARSRVAGELTKRLPDDDDNVFRQVKRMRHIKSHEADDTKREEWVSVQGDFAKRLGRRWRSPEGKKYPELYAPGDIQITALEATSLKASYIAGVATALEHLLSLAPSTRSRILKAAVSPATARTHVRGRMVRHRPQSES